MFIISVYRELSASERRRQQEQIPKISSDELIITQVLQSHHPWCHLFLERFRTSKKLLVRRFWSLKFVQAIQPKLYDLMVCFRITELSATIEEEGEKKRPKILPAQPQNQNHKAPIACLETLDSVSCASWFPSLIERQSISEMFLFSFVETRREVEKEC